MESRHTYYIVKATSELYFSSIAHINFSSRHRNISHHITTAVMQFLEQILFVLFWQRLVEVIESW